MTTISDLVKRSFLISYAREFVFTLEETATRNCPTECNWIDEETHEYVYRADKTKPNFMSQAAFAMYPLVNHLYVKRESVIDRYYMTVSKYDLCSDCENSIFWRCDPFELILEDWAGDFDMCLYELLLE